jgi:protein-S-isoprenylcysteine O-methyltransferase Ste14
LIALWAQPIMPAEMMMMNGGLTLYVLIALELEENDLVRDYGEEYEKYRKEVPMLIPWKVFSRRSQA